MDLVRRVAPIVAWVVGLVAVLAGMSALGHGALAPPDLGRPGTWADWLAARTAADAAVAVVRLVVVALASYLLAVTVLAVVLRLGRAGRLVTVADLVTVPFVRSLVQAGVGVGLAGAVVVVPPVATPVALASAVSPAPVLAPLPAASPPPVMVKVVEAPAEAEVEAERTWAVAPGDHFWSIARRVLDGAWGRPAADRELAPFWAQLVDANRSRLADPGNPDLLFPGQQLVVPAPPPAP